jgi:hypothetical protein
MKMIEAKENEGWNVLFLAANQDAISSGASIGVKGGKAMSWGTDEISIGNTYSNLSANIGSYRKYKIENGDLSDNSLDFTEQQREESKKS